MVVMPLVGAPRLGAPPPRAALEFPNGSSFGADGLNTSATIYARVPATTIVEPTRAFTVTGKFKLAAANKAGRQALVAQYDDSFVEAWGVGLSGGFVYIQGNGNTNVATATDYADGLSHDFALVFDRATFDAQPGTGSKVYIDGVLAHSFDVSFLSGAITQRPTIGGIGNVTNSFLGSIKEVAFWSGIKFTGSYTPTTYVGNEDYLLALYHLTADGADSWGTLPSGNTAALTGQGVSAALGSVTPTINPALTGQAITTAQGSVGAGLGLTGQVVTAGLGTVAPSVSFTPTSQTVTAAQGQVLQGAPLTGQALAVAQGLLTAGVTLALTGQSVAAARGTVGPTASTALAGQSVTAAQGQVLQGAPLVGQTVAAGQGSVTATPAIALTGQVVSVGQGSVTRSASVALTGQALTANQGAILAAPSLALTGQNVTVGPNTAPGSVTLALAGQAMSVAQGNVTASSPGGATLAGQALAAAQGAVSPSAVIALTGQSVSAAISSLAVTSGPALVGQAVVAAQGVVVAVAADVTVALTGQALALQQGAITAAGAAAQAPAGTNRDKATARRNERRNRQGERIVRADPTRQRETVDIEALLAPKPGPDERTTADKASGLAGQGGQGSTSAAQAGGEAATPALTAAETLAATLAAAGANAPDMAALTAAGYEMPDWLKALQMPVIVPGVTPAPLEPFDRFALARLEDLDLMSIG